MDTEQQDISKMFIILSHHLRREILLQLYEKDEQSFTDLLTTLEVDTGTLSFHIRKLKSFLDQTPSGKYKLNSQGQRALNIIRDVESLSIETHYVTNNQALPIAAFKKRAMAFIVDIAIAFVITIATVLFTNFDEFLTQNYSFDFNIFTFLFLLWLYSTLLEGYAGQTLGKEFLGIKVVSVGGKKLNYDSSAVRNFGKCFLLPIDLLIGLRLKDKRFIKYFDKFSRTTVINVTGKNKK